MCIRDRNELGEITDLCEQHNATGYILICSTQPSAAVIARLEKISQKGKIKEIYWDATKIELMPVSYTHLDVYKRQTHILTLFFDSSSPARV